MIAMLHRALLEERHWLGQDDFILCFAMARLTPGTNVLAFCTGIGWRLRGAAGAIVALLAASLPCGVMVLGATALFSHWQNNRWAQAVIEGAIAAAVAITIRMCWTIVQPLWQGRARLRVAVIGAGAFIAYAWLGVPAISILLLAAAFGAALPAWRRA